MIFRLFLAAFIALSLYSTIAKTNLYPVNAYRMFSRNWLGQTIGGIEAYDAANVRRVLWTDTRIPFFQVNSIAVQVLLGQDNEAKERLCQWIRGKIGSPRLALHAVGRKYVRAGGKIEDTPISNEKVYSCAVKI